MKLIRLHQNRPVGRPVVHTLRDSAILGLWEQYSHMRPKQRSYFLKARFHFTISASSIARIAQRESVRLSLRMAGYFNHTSILQAA